MDFSKIFAIISTFVLIVCLTLSITTLVILRNAIDENEQLQVEADRLLDDLNASVDKLDTTVNTKPPSNQTEQEDVLTNAEAEVFSVREYNGKIAIYNADGAMIHWVDVNTALLPIGERTALEQGIEIQTWDSLISYLQDYMS